MAKGKRRKESLSVRLLKELNANISRLEKTLRVLNGRGIKSEAVGGFRAFWRNLIAGSARGVGMVFGASFMTAIGLAVLYAAFYWLLHYLNMIPLLSDMAAKLSELFHQFIERSPGGA